jgi:hypothetical protein
MSPRGYGLIGAVLFSVAAWYGIIKLVLACLH